MNKRNLQARLAMSRYPKNEAERKLVNEKAKKESGYIEEPKEDDGFYGHVLPSDFKRTRIIRTYGRS